jgi:hypothetical protein
LLMGSFREDRCFLLGRLLRFFPVAGIVAG